MMVVVEGLYSLTLRVDVRSGPTRSIPVWRWLKMDRNSTHVRGYHFTMSQEGTWVSEGDRFTYTGPCGLSLHIMCNGSSMMLPHPDSFLDVSITMPSRRAPSTVLSPRVPRPYDSEEVGPSTRRRTWQDSLDAPSSRRAVRSKVPESTTSRWTPPSPPDLADVFGTREDEEVEQEDEEEDEVIELINIESSIEVVDISSDLESEEDPSEGSCLPASTGSAS
ncbi:unnamed protein product [Lupinus luteus]|uniref:Uncharacterized protein n=1 Tax=Lupinus luteus TaxID=3873 RepID=A0AAV1X690_LUPLU